MLAEIVARTPVWVFFLFFVLLILGYIQSKDRKIGRYRIVILPMVMICLSFYGIVSAFGIGQPVSLMSWVMGLVCAGLLSLWFPSPSGVYYSPKELSFSLPGSWLPLSLMLAIFFIKYAVGVILARRLPIINENIFVASVSLCYGLISGIFLFRAFVIWRSRKADNTMSGTL